MPQQSLLKRGIKFTPLLIILWATVWVVAPRWGAATIKRPRSTYDVRWQVVGGARHTHRFFDSSAISPSGPLRLRDADAPRGPRGRAAWRRGGGRRLRPPEET